MVHLALLDWGVVLVYIFAMLWLGFVLSKSQTSTKNYFLGNREMSWLPVGLSIVATETSALTIIGTPALAYSGNLSFIQITIGYILARILITLFMIPQYFKGGMIYTPYQIVSDKFGGSARTVIVYLIMISGFLAAGVRVYVTAIPLKLVLGIDIEVAIIIFSIIAVIYTYLGGIKAVIWTDVVQFLIFMTGGIFALFYIPTLVAGGWGHISKVASEAGKMAWFNPAFKLTGDFNIWMGVIGATFLCATSHGADQLLVMRILSCKSEKEGKKAMLFSALIILPIFLVFLFIGLMLYVYYQTNPFAISPYDSAGVLKADWIFPIFIISKVPVVVKGLLIAAIFAAAMSSIDSALSALSSVFVMDIHKPYFAENKDEAYYISFSKKIVVLFGVILAFVAFLCQNVDLILNLAFKLTGITSGAILGGMIFSFLSSGKGQGWPIITGMLVSSAAMGWIVYNTSVHWSWLPFFGTIITLAVSYLLIPFSKEMEKAA